MFKVNVRVRTQQHIVLDLHIPLARDSELFLFVPESRSSTVVAKATPGPTGGSSKASSGRRISDLFIQSGRVDVSGLRQWIPAQPSHRTWIPHELVLFLPKLILLPAYSFSILSTSCRKNSDVADRVLARDANKICPQIVIGFLQPVTSRESVQ